MRILIIEDDLAIRQTLQELLEINGFEVLAAADGPEGLRLAESNPDFIFCDVSMPEMDGTAVLEEIRKREQGRLVPFVFLTAKARRDDQRRGMTLGADDYITKPFSEQEILDAITSRTRRHRPLQERVDELMEQRRRQVGADWSHELLTPLNGMLGGLQLLDMEIETMSRDDLQQIIALIRGGVERQEKLSRKLIRYFELERLKEAPRPADGFRCQADEAATAGARRAATEAQREQDLAVYCQGGMVRLPAAFLDDAIAELTGNALRFSKPGQMTRVEGTKLGSYYRIEVIDQGSGMTEEERTAIAPFTQFGRAKREQQGLGLGLAIARSVAEVGGGSVHLATGPGDRGIKVTLTLPLV